MSKFDQTLHLGIAEQVAHQQRMLSNFAQVGEQTIDLLLAELLHNGLPLWYCLPAFFCILTIAEQQCQCMMQCHYQTQQNYPQSSDGSQML